MYSTLLPTQNATSGVYLAFLLSNGDNSNTFFWEVSVRMELTHGTWSGLHTFLHCKQLRCSSHTSGPDPGTEMQQLTDPQNPCLRELPSREAGLRAG